jgi:hypothetical protein
MNGHGSGAATPNEEEAWQNYDIGEPSRTFGAVGPDPFPAPPSGPSQAAIEDRPLVKAAAAVKDPFGGKTPPLYSRRPDNH